MFKTEPPSTVSEPLHVTATRFVSEEILATVIIAPVQVEAAGKLIANPPPVVVHRYVFPAAALVTEETLETVEE
jgi:hypothetical protein